MAGMSPAGGPLPPGQDKGAGGEGDEMTIAQTLMRVFEKWRTTAKDKKAAEPYINRMADILKEYMTTVLKAGPEGMAGAQPPATPPPAPSAPAPGGAGPGETQPVPA